MSPKIRQNPLTACNTYKHRKPYGRCGHPDTLVQKEWNAWAGKHDTDFARMKDVNTRGNCKYYAHYSGLTHEEKWDILGPFIGFMVFAGIVLTVVLVCVFS